jgi:hypothetical protein
VKCIRVDGRAMIQTTAISLNGGYNQITGWRIDLLEAQVMDSVISGNGSG